MSRVVDAIFRVTDQFSGPLKNFNTALTDVGRQGRQARKQIADIGNSIAGVGTALTASVTVPLVAAGTAAVTYAGEVSKSMELARATAGATAEEWVQAEQAAMDAAKAHTFTMEDASEAALNFARQGFQAADMTYLMGNAMDFAQGTGTDLEQTSASLGNIMKGFGLAMEDTTRVADELAKAQSLANTNGSELLTGVEMMAPIMRTLGYDTADSAALIAAWGDAGVSAAEGATAWKTSVARLASPTKDAETWMNRLNFTLFDENGAAKDLVEVQAELNAAFSTLTAQEKEQAAAAIFGKNQMSKMMMIIDTAPDKFSALEESIRDSNGTSKELSDSMMNSLGGSIESLKSSIDVLKYSLGDLLGEYVQPIIEKITGWVDKLNDLDDAHKKQIIRYAGIAAAVGPILIIFGKLIVGASKLMGAFAGIAKAGGVLKAGLAALSAPAAVVIAIIGAIAAVIAVIVTHIDEVKASVAKMKANCAPHLEKLGEAFGKLKDAVSPVLNFIKDTFVNAVLGAVDAICGSEALPFIIDVVTNVVNAVADGINGMVGFFSDLATNAAPYITEFQNTFNSIVEGVTNFVNTLVENAAPHVETFVNTVSTSFNGLVEALGPYFESICNLFNSIKDTLEPAYEWFRDTFIAGFKGAWEGLASSDGIGQFIDGIGGMISGLIDTFKSIIEFLTDVFTGDWEGAWESVKSIFSSVMDTITSIIETVKGVIQSIVDAVQGAASAVQNFAAEHGMDAVQTQNSGRWGVAGYLYDKAVGSNAAGTNNWRGGLTRVNESGGEIMNLPSGTQIIPHDASLNTHTNAGGDISVAKLADTIVVREDADIERITDALVRKLIKAKNNMGVYSMA